jgi:phage/plasmid-associated DNA primase
LLNVLQIADKFIAIADDSTKDAQLDQQAFQQMVSAGSLSLGVKFKDALVVDPWKTPLIMTQNGDLHFHDNAGSIARRVVTFVFEKKIAKPDPDLFDKIRDTELLNIMVKQDRIYRSLARFVLFRSFI